MQIRSSSVVSLAVARAAFEGLDQLMSLDLSENPVKLAGGTQGLCALTSLQELHLASSFLSSLDDIGKMFSSTQYFSLLDVC